MAITTDSALNMEFGLFKLMFSDKCYLNNFQEKFWKIADNFLFITSANTTYGRLEVPWRNLLCSWASLSILRPSIFSGCSNSMRGLPRFSAVEPWRYPWNIRLDHRLPFICSSCFSWFTMFISPHRIQASYNYSTLFNSCLDLGLMYTICYYDDT